MASTNGGTGTSGASSHSSPQSHSPAAEPHVTVAEKGAAKETAPMTNTATTSPTTGFDADTVGTDTNAHREEAKSRFSSAVQEAKAGAAALRAEAGERASVYRDQARDKGSDLKTDARLYGDEAKVKGKELATEGKGKLSEGIAALGQMVSDNAHVVDEKVGAKYGDYARSASRSLSDTAARIDSKSVDELAEDGREFVRKSPGLAIGIAAGVGFMLSRLFSRN